MFELPPMPATFGTVTLSANSTAAAASNALPPALRISAPAAVASALSVTTTSVGKSQIVTSRDASLFSVFASAGAAPETTTLSSCSGGRSSVPVSVTSACPPGSTDTSCDASGFVPSSSVATAAAPVSPAASLTVAVTVKGRRLTIGSGSASAPTARSGRSCTVVVVRRTCVLRWWPPVRTSARTCNALCRSTGGRWRTAVPSVSDTWTYFAT
jgi:hypothetical protein